MIPRFFAPYDISRPLQFVPPFEEWCGTTEDRMRSGFQCLLDAGFGGLVTTVSLNKYLCDDKAWDVLRRGVDVARNMGLRIWIYDEKGYPSGAAGGLVIAQMPEAEARGLIRTIGPSGQPQYEVIRLYEDTHATANFYEKRPYINILDPQAVATFIAITHDRYERTLHPIRDYVEAFFTDEPSLISTYVPQGKDYPKTLPWHPTLPEIFRSRKGYDVAQHWESLFVDTGEIDRKIRCDFYEVVADLCAETYFGQLQRWCHSHRVSSSGHLLGEETLVWQTLFNGDPFSCYRKFDISGIDMILSDPGRIMAEKFFLVPKIAASATRLQGKRRVMCEISDFFGAMDGRHSTMSQMKSTAGILMSLGVTDFVSMYTVSLQPHQEADRDPKARRFSAEEFRGYTDYVTRVNNLLSDGRVVTRIAVLHPLLTIWAHFTPSERSMYEPHPNQLVRFVDDSFTNLCRELLQQQVDFDVIDERSLVDASVEKGTLIVGEREYDLLILPPMDTVRLQTMKRLLQFVELGGSVLAHPLVPTYAAEGSEKDKDINAMVEKIVAKGGMAGSTPGAAPLLYLLKSRIPPACTLSPAFPHILCTVVSRGGGLTYFFVNTSSVEYKGRCTLRSIGQPIAIDPETDKERKIACTKVDSTSSEIALTLSPFASLFVVF